MEHGTQGQKQVDDQVTRAHKVTVAWEEALRDGTGEEEGRQQEGSNLDDREGQ